MTQPTCRACDGPTPFQIVPICDLCLAQTMSVITEMLSSADEEG